MNLRDGANYSTVAFLTLENFKNVVLYELVGVVVCVCHSRIQSLMEAVLQIRIRPLRHRHHHQSMNSLCYKLRPNHRPSFFYAHLRAFCSSSPPPLPSSVIHSSPSVSRRDVRVRVGLSDAQLKENWLASLSCPFPQGKGTATATAAATTYFGNGEADRVYNGGSDWVLGIDPDTSGALAILKGDDFADSAQVVVINFVFLKILADFSSIAPQYGLG